MAEPTLSRTGITFIQDPRRRLNELGVTDHNESEPYGPEYQQRCYDADCLYRRLKTERDIEAEDRKPARRREMHRREKIGRGYLPKRGKIFPAVP